MGDQEIFFFSDKNPMLSTLAFTLYRLRALGSLQFFLEDSLAFFTFMFFLAFAAMYLFYMMTSKM